MLITLVVVLPSRILCKLIVSLQLFVADGPEVHLFGEGGGKRSDGDNLLEVITLGSCHHDVASVDDLRLLNLGIHPSAQVIVTLAFAHELNHTLALDLIAKHVAVSVLLLRIVGQSGTDAHRLYALLHFLHVACEGVVLGTIPRGNGIGIGQLVQALSIHQ